MIKGRRLVHDPSDAKLSREETYRQMAAEQEDWSDWHNAETSFRQGFKEALNGETHPVSELWKDLDAE